MDTHSQKKALTEAKSAQNQPRTQVGELRDWLLTIERRISKLNEISPEDALEILSMLDQAQERLDALDTAGASVSSEGAQFESLLLQFSKKDGTFVNQVGGPSALQKARQSRQPDARYWWWYIDESLAQKRQLKIKRWAIGASIVGVLLILVVVLYNQFLAPDPEFQAGIGFQQNAENKLITGRYEEALLDVEQAVERLPDYPELYVLQGVLYEMLEQPDLAEQSFENAQSVFEREESFYNERAQYYLMLNLAEQSIADAEMALSINPDSAISLLYLGQAYEVLGDISTAIEYYEAASAAAERTGNIQVQVIARMNLAQALQNISSFTTPTPTE